MSWDEVAIGLDVGGTKIAAGLIDRHGKVLVRRTVPTDAAQGGMAVLKKALGLAQALRASAEAEGYKVAGVGVSVCELVDPQGAITSEYTLQWRKIPVQTIFSVQVAPAVIVADVRAHAFAEARFGAGRKLASFVFVNVGTGISSCLVLEGRPYAGARGNALVLATMPLVVFDEQERKLEFALEAFSSGLGLIERYRRHKAGIARVEEIIADAAQGNEIAGSVLRSGGEALGGAIAWLVNVLDPEAVIVGGGLGLADGLYWESLVATARVHIFADASRTLPILHAACGADAGVIGAGASIFAR
ncbi:MAG: ROK family protein [Caldilinea sp.]|nr:ROK family protein [Caldilinea sp.]MDW8439455.1 ROK family protein [Caldilineaceae bacterium]